MIDFKLFYGELIKVFIGN